MPEGRSKAFWEAIQADTGLQQKLQGVTEPDAVAAIAKEAGFSISAEEIKKAQSEELELTDEQLEGVAGANIMHGSSMNFDWCQNW
jgi:predicted ribosomally synthesized peptide with nif11-like leader